MIRVSCAGLARIKIDDKYLLILNANSVKVGKPAYGPLGGALEFNDSIRPFLDSLNCQYEKGNDLRLLMPLENYNKFREWFLLRQNREKSSIREIYEEICLEEKIANFSTILDLKEKFIKTLEANRNSNRKGVIGMPTKGFYEIYDVKISQNLEEQLLEYIANGGNVI